MTAHDQAHRHIATGQELEPEFFPELGTFSIASMYRFLPVIPALTPSEVVYVPPPKLRSERVAFVGAIAEWNSLWESGHLRREMLKKSSEHWPRCLHWLFNDDLVQGNVRLVPLYAKARWMAYNHLYHLLPLDVLIKHGLPPLKRALWPQMPWGYEDSQGLVPIDVTERLGSAFASHLWRYLNRRSSKAAFGKSESMVVLAHNLDFWLPYVDLMIQERARSLGRVPYDPERLESDRRRHARLRKLYKDAPFSSERPLYGGSLWLGQTEAGSATERVVELADQDGRLRGILDIFRSHRVQDDFSDLWSREREDFERKLYAKRNKVTVSFVQLNDTAAVHSPEVEYHKNILWSDLLAILDKKERSIMICLRNGRTQLEISSLLGYANHSAVCKALARIRGKAKRLLG